MRLLRFFGLVLFLLIVFCACKNRKTVHENHADPVFQQPQIMKLSEQIQDAPENAKLYYQRGNALRRLGADTLALHDFTKAASLDSTNSAYFSAVGDLLFEHKDINGSIPWIEKAVKLNPNDPTARLKIAKLFIYIKNYPKAFAEINTVLRQNTMTPEGYFLKGMIYKDMGDTARSISSFQTAVQVSPDYKEAILQLGLLHSAKHENLALKYFDNAYRLDTNDVFPLYARGMFFQEQEQFENAKQEYARAVSVDPDYASAYFNTGWILMQQDSLEKARRQFDIVTRLEPVSAAAYYNRGLCSELMHQQQQAIDDYKQALVFDEEYEEARAGLRRLQGK